MRRGHLILTVALVALLLGSNLWWLYHAFDQAVTETYHEQELDERLRSLDAALRTIPPLAADLSRDEIVTRAAAAIQEPAPFDKDGATVIAPLTFTFDTRGKLVEVGTIYRDAP